MVSEDGNRYGCRMTVFYIYSEFRTKGKIYNPSDTDSIYYHFL
jgi:hypothetical protein